LEGPPRVDAGQFLHRGKDLHRHRECALTTRHELVHEVAVGLAVLLDAIWKLVATVCQDAGRLSAEVRPGSDVEQVGLLVLALPHPLRTGQREPGLTPDRTEPEKVE